MIKVAWPNEAPRVTIERLDEPTYYESAYSYATDAVSDEKPWFYGVKRHLKGQEYPKDVSVSDKKTLRKLAAKFFLNGGVSYKRNYNSVLLRCVDRHEAAKIIEETHEGAFETHSRAINYFTKWVKAASYANVTKQVVARFIKRDIICRNGVPERITTDNGSNLNNKMMKELCESFKIMHYYSSPYRQKMISVVKAVNKNNKKIVQKMVITYKDWHEMLHFALHGYRTSVCTSTGENLFSLVYSMEAVLLVEVEIPSLRIIQGVKLE
ncbi:uncharacterized protein LOC131619517 [Vicia villosa]|uniref:uncharacterized protein LOC131619516 n=1 Tax=Vicia villosa TaxID=3911 RepID=UPI00273B5797|nr:uncharacterized protein LOC131619516 [Vicia villosa]XP_058746588.1 uncharacterized protein LOC131619517 [Vicia villosa]